MNLRYASQSSQFLCDEVMIIPILKTDTKVQWGELTWPWSARAEVSIHDSWLSLGAFLHDLMVASVI